MLKYYITLGVSEDSSDEEIRKKYLQLVNVYTPEKFPAEFEKITRAYEAVKTEDKRIHLKIFAYFESASFFEDEIRELANAKAFEVNKKIKLKDIIDDSKKIQQSRLR